MEEQNINYTKEQISPPRRHKGINALVLTIILSLTFTGASGLRSNLCSPEAKTSNFECLGINIFLLLHIPFAQISVRNTLEYFFPREAKNQESRP